MSGSFNASGLITGLDTNSIIRQLMQVERKPITRMQSTLTSLQSKKTAIMGLRTQLLTLRNRAQDFRFSNILTQFKSASSKDTVLTAEISGSNPVTGAYAVDVTQLASATVAVSSGPMGSAVNPGVALNSSGISGTIQAGTFTVNGVQFNIDPATESLNTVIGNINGQSATTGVTASYDAVTDKVKFENTTPGNTSVINFGASADTSNLLSILNVQQATQVTGSGGATEAISTNHLGAIDPDAILNTTGFAGGAMTSGSFRVNGVTVNVDVTTQSLSDILSAINSSDSGITASYDASTDRIQVVSKTLGSRTVSFLAGTSNFLSATNLTSATQTAGKDAQFSINGGPTLTRNTNKVSDAVGGVTLNLLSQGQSTVTVSTNDDSVVEGVKSFITQFNTTLTQVHDLVVKGGTLAGDFSIQSIDNILRDTIFGQVTGISGSYSSLLDLGISTGDTFDASAVPQLALDEDKFGEALRSDRTNVANLFSNTGKTGVADQLFSYLDSATSSAGFLNERAGANGGIDQQIRSINDDITSMEARLTQREARLRAQFTQLEQITNNLKSQNSSISSLSSALW